MRESRSAVVARHRRNNPAFVRAHEVVTRAIARGDLVRASNCQHCGKECRTEASHFDYSKPLYVEWLCRKCHAIKDRASECPNGHPYTPGSYSVCSKGRRSCNACRLARAERTEARRLAKNRGHHD